MEKFKEALNELKNNINTMFKEFFNKETNKKQRANMLTFSRLISSFIIPILVLLGKTLSSQILYILAATTTTYATITDFIDGKVARKYNSTSTFGATIDAISDKIFSLMIGLSLSLFNPIFLINIIGELTIGTTNIIYRYKNEECSTKSSILGKIKQWPLSLTYVLGLLSLLTPNISNIIPSMVCTTLLFQTAALTNYIITNNEIIRKDKAKKELMMMIEETTVSIDEEKKHTKLDEYKKLKEVLNEIIDLQNNEEIIENNKIRKKELK